jgi:hypothetical protein
VNQPAFDIEARLRAALAPVDPPEELALRLETTLGSLVPAAAVLVGSGAAVGLVVLRTRRRRHKRRAQSHNPLDLAERTLRDVAREALRVFEDAQHKR